MHSKFKIAKYKINDKFQTKKKMKLNHNHIKKLYTIN